MDRNREARRTSAMTPPSTNGISRRRHRSTSLRDSPEEEGAAAEMQEQGRLRDRTAIKSGNRERDRTARSKKRRVDDESSEGSVNDDVDDDEDDDDAMVTSNHGSAVGHGHHQHVAQQFSSRSSTSKAFAAVNNHNINNKTFKPVQGWKPADEMIGFSVPRKARSVSKRSHENWISGAGATPEHILRQASPSPSPSTAPLSPSSSNVSVRKKMKTNGSKQKPPKSSSKASSSNPEELEIEIAEVLYGLRTQSEPPLKKEADPMTTKIDTNKTMIESRSRVSSPISNSAPTAPQNSSSSTVPFSAVAPKRKKPRQISENFSSFSARNSPISSIPVKSELDQPPKTESLLPNSLKNSTIVSENGNFQSLSLNFATSETPAKELVVPKGSPVKESPAEDSDVAMTKVNLTSSVMDTQKEEKFEIDLMAPPPQLRSSPERESDTNFAAVAEPKPVISVAADTELRSMLVSRDTDVKASKSGRDEMKVEEPELKKMKSIQVSAESEKASMIKERNIDLQLDLEKPDRDNNDSVLLSGNKSHPPHVQKQQQPQLKVAKDEAPHLDKTAQPSSVPLSMTLASWPGGAPPMGYMAPLQGVVSMDGSQVPPTPVQPLFTQPRPKRCATHCYVARNIHYLQQCMKMNPFWPTPTAGPPSLFGQKPSNHVVAPPMELHGRGIPSVQDNKGQGLAVFPGKEKASQGSVMVDAQRKQQQQPILLQQALPAGAPPANMMHGPAFIFPFNQHQTAAAVAAASVRPPPTKSPTTDPITAAASAPPNGSSTAVPTPPPVSFNYPNMPANETQYLAILQNNAYPFPIPAPNYRGTHPQPMPFFNGSFYTSQMIHPSQLQQQPPTQHQQIPPGQQNTSISSGSSSSQKQQLQAQQQQRPQQGNSNLSTFPAIKNKPAQQSQPHQGRHIETEPGHEDSPSSADSRSSRGQNPMTVYNQNFSMPIHHQTFALVGSNSNGNNNNQGENKKQQQSQPKPGGLESHPQTFAVSFASMNGGNTAHAAPGGSIDLSSVAQNHAVFPNFTENDRRTYQVMQAAAIAQAAQQRKNFRVTEEGKTGNSSNNDEEKKAASKVSVTSGQSIAFTRPDLADPSVSPLTGSSVIDSSARNPNNSNNNNNRGSRNSVPNNSQLGQLQNMQFQQQHVQQQMVQIQKQQQQQQLQQQFTASRNNKSQPTSNGYGDHLSTSSPSGSSKFPNSISVFPQNNSPSNSPQWKSSNRAAPQTQSSSTPLIKNPHFPQHQQARPPQNHTQISFGSGQKPQAGPHQSSSPPMGVGSPTTSLSKGGGGSPRAPSSNSQGNKASSLSSQQSKNSSSSLKSPSILGNPHNIASSNSTTKSQQQLQHLQNQQQQMKQMANQQPQLFFSPAFMQTQPPQPTSNPGNTTSGYYLQRRYPEKQPQQQGGSPSGTSTGMLSHSSTVTQASSNTVEAKAGSANNSTKGPASMMNHPQFQQQSAGSYTYIHTVPAGVQVKSTTEPKQPAGSRDMSTRK